MHLLHYVMANDQNKNSLMQCVEQHKASMWGEVLIMLKRWQFPLISYQSMSSLRILVSSEV